MVKMALSCCRKSVCVTYRNNIKSWWGLLLLKLFSLISYRKKLKNHESVFNDHDYCYVEMPHEDNKILKYNHGEKSLRAPFMIYAELECLLENMYSCENNLEKSYTQKKN